MCAKLGNILKNELKMVHLSICKKSIKKPCKLIWDWKKLKEQHFKRLNFFTYVYLTLPYLTTKKCPKAAIGTTYREQFVPDFKFKKLPNLLKKL